MPLYLSLLNLEKISTKMMDVFGWPSAAAQDDVRCSPVIDRVCWRSTCTECQLHVIATSQIAIGAPARFISSDRPNL